MKFACKSCGTKYQIPDEKVAGKNLRMKCRRCNEAILIRGQNVQQSRAHRAEARAQGSYAGPAPKKNTSSGLFHAADGRPKATAKWHVAINDTPVGPITRDEVAVHIAKGELVGESLCWCEGMDDWGPISSVASLASLLDTRRSVPPPPTGGSHRPSAPPAVSQKPNAPSALPKAAQKSLAPPPVSKAPKGSKAPGTPSGGAPPPPARSLKPSGRPKVSVPAISQKPVQPELGSLPSQLAEERTIPSDPTIGAAFDANAKKDKDTGQVASSTSTKAEGSRQRSSTLGGSLVPDGREKPIAVDTAFDNVRPVRPEAGSDDAEGIPSALNLRPSAPTSGVAGVSEPSPAPVAAAAPMPSVLPDDMEFVDSGMTSFPSAAVAAKASRSSVRHGIAPTMFWAFVGFAVAFGLMIGLGVVFEWGRFSGKPTQVAMATAPTQTHATAPVPAEVKAETKVVAEVQPEPTKSSDVAAAGTATSTARGKAVKNGHKNSLRQNENSKKPAAGANGSGAKKLSAEQQKLLARMGAGGSGGSPSLNIATKRNSTAKKAKPLDGKIISSVVQKQRKRLQRCYEQAIRGQASPPTVRLDVSVSVAPAGNVKKVKLKGSDLAGLKPCVQRSVKMWRFPATDGGDAKFPVVFQGR